MSAGDGKRDADRGGGDPALLSDAAAPTLPRWPSHLGLAWLLLLGGVLFGPPAGDPPALALLLLAGILLAAAARWAGQPGARPLPARGAILLTLLLWGALALLLGDNPFEGRGASLLLAALLAFATPQLLRTKSALRRGALLLVALAGALTLLPIAGGTADWHRAPLLPGFLALLVGLAPFLLSHPRLPGRTLGAALLLVAVGGLTAAARTFSQMPPFPSTDTSWHEALYALAALPAVLSLCLQALRDRRRWRGDFPQLAHGLPGGCLASAGALLAAALLHRPWVEGPLFPATGLVLGISFALRERAIHQDPTRHPPRRPTPLRSYLEETAVIARALLSLPPPRGRGGARPPRLDEGGSELALPFEDGTPSWAVVVMHMHSNRWEGAFSPEEMVEHYRRIGADAVVVTDHNRLTRPRHPAAPLPAYEHGWGPHNHHVLVLGAEETLPEGEPFGGRDPLARLHRLREQSSAFLVLAHPNSSRAWPRTLLRRPDLDADAIELFNKSAISLDRWDDALSAGHLLWGTAGDDCHDLRSRHQTAKRYLLVDLRDFDRNRSSHPTGEQLLSALRQGRFLACWQGRHEDTRRLPVPGQPLPTRFEVDGEGVTVYLDRPAEMVEIVEPGGAIVETLASAPSFRLAPPHGVLYQRALLRHGSHTIAFNPVARLRATL